MSSESDSRVTDDSVDAIEWLMAIDKDIWNDAPPHPRRLFCHKELEHIARIVRRDDIEVEVIPSHPCSTCTPNAFIFWQGRCIMHISAYHLPMRKYDPERAIRFLRRLSTSSEPKESRDRQAP